MNTFKVKVKEINGDVFHYDPVNKIKLEDARLDLVYCDTKNANHSLNYADEIIIKPNHEEES